MNTKTKKQTQKTKKTFLFLSFCFLISALCFSNISFFSNLFQGDSNLLTENISPIKEVEAKDRELTNEKTYNTDVFDIGDNQKKYKIHVGHINYKDKETERFEKIDTTLIPSSYGWEMNKASYRLELPEYADDWFKFVNDYEEDLQEGSTQEYGANDSETVAMKPLNVSHTKGELIETEENGWNNKKILYKNAFGNNIDLEVIAKNIGFDKLVVINEKPKDLEKDLEFSFEINLDDFEVESEGEIWNEKEPLETSNRIILSKLKDTWFREFRVWDSEGKSGKIRVRIEKQNQKTISNEIALSASAGARTGLINLNYSIAENKKPANMADSLEFQNDSLNSDLTFNEIIADQNNLSSFFVNNFLGGGLAGNRTPETLMSNQSSSHSEPTANLLYQNKSQNSNNDKYIFTKIIDKEFLENAVYPVYTDDTVSYYAGAGDGVVNTSNSVWDTVHDATSGTANYTATSDICQSRYIAGISYYIDRAFFSIDTSAINDGDTITAANFYLTVTSSDYSPGYNASYSWFTIVQGFQTATNSLTANDFDDCGNLIDNPTEGTNDRKDVYHDFGSGIPSGYYNWALNATGIGWIDKTGFTKLGIRDGFDVLDYDSGISTRDNNITFATSESTTDPYLSVTASSNTAPSSTFDNDFSTWETGAVTVNYNLIDAESDTLNISQTATSGIEYSTDGSTWLDATDAGGASEGLTGLASSASPGTNHIFVWDSATDLPTTEDSTVYLRVRPNDGTVDADAWVTSDAFGIDNVLPTITNITSTKANGSYTTGEVIDINLTFSETVTTVNATVTLDTAQTCLLTTTNSTSGTCDYTVQAGDTKRFECQQCFRNYYRPSRKRNDQLYSDHKSISK